MLFFIPAEMSAFVLFASSGCSLDTFFGCSGCSCALSTSAGVRKKATAAAKTSRVNIKVIPPYCALSHHSLHVSVRQRRSDYRCCRRDRTISSAIVYLRATCCPLLDWRAGYRSVTAEHAAISELWLQLRAASGTV